MVKIAQGPRNAVAPEGLENLSEDERKAFMRQTTRHGGGRIVSDQATVPQKVHQDKVRELEGEISSLRSKVEELKAERNQIREERDSYRDRFERKLEELKASESAMEQLRSERSELGDRVRALQAKVDSAPKEPKVVRDDTEVKRLQKEKRETGWLYRKRCARLPGVRETQGRGARSGAGDGQGRRQGIVAAVLRGGGVREGHQDIALDDGVRPVLQPKVPGEDVP